MTTRRAFSMAVLGVTAAAGVRRGALAQADQDTDDLLGHRGAPTGRVGAATRSIQGGNQNLTLDLVAPKRGVGFTSSDRPTLCYLLSGPTNASLRLTISQRGQARPLADLELPHPAARFGVVDLRYRDVRLAPGQLYIWSVSLRLDPKDPSHDLVASALIQYKPGDAAFEKAVRDASVEQRHGVFEQNGYWYDEVALAAGNYDRDKGSALTELLRKAGLQTATSSGGPAH